MPNIPQLLSGKTTKLLHCVPDRPVIPSEDRILLSNLTSGSIFVSFGGMSTIGRLVIGSWWDHEISASNCARRKEENFWPRMRECFKKAAKIGPGLRLTFRGSIGKGISMKFYKIVLSLPGS